METTWLIISIVLFLLIIIINLKPVARILKQKLFGLGIENNVHAHMHFEEEREYPVTMQLDNVLEESNIADKLRKEIAGLKKGLLQFDPPPEMTIGNEYQLAASIVPNTGMAAEPSPATGDVIKTGSVMKLELLTFDDDFIVKTNDADYKIIKHDQPTVWKWKVKPQRKGETYLQLKVFVKIKLPGYTDEPFESFSEEKTILVKGSKVYSTKQFVKKNGPAIISFFLGNGLLFTILKAFKIIS